MHLKDQQQKIPIQCFKQIPILISIMIVTLFIIILILESFLIKLLYKKIFIYYYTPSGP